MSSSILKLPPSLEARVKFSTHQVQVTPATLRLALNCLDLTSLKGSETNADIGRLCHLATQYALASVCVLPSMVKIAARYLKDTDVGISTVINFPYGDRRTGEDAIVTPETTAEDIARVIGAGATQIDIVQPHEIRPGMAQDIIRAARMACPANVTLMSILETASFKHIHDLGDAALIAIASGADFLKTSTGMHSHGGATPEAVAALQQVIKKTNRQVGIKISGGVQTPEQCAQYIALQRSFFGWDSVRRDCFRIGGSQVLNNLVKGLNSVVDHRLGAEMMPANDDPSLQNY